MSEERVTVPLDRIREQLENARESATEMECHVARLGETLGRDHRDTRAMSANYAFLLGEISYLEDLVAAGVDLDVDWGIAELHGWVTS